MSSAVATSAGDLDTHRPLLWAIAYRMTGVAADADDVVQETFARAVAQPPARDRPVRPWLVKVAMNVARDQLRRRRRTAYPGPWLPSPVEDGRLDEVDRLAAGLADGRPGPEQRYSLRESATFAFLLALEELTPLRRAVLILRDVFDYSTEETAAALGISVDAAKQALSRARRSLTASDARRRAARAAGETEARRRRDEAAFGRLFAALLAGDTATVEGMLADDVEAHTDGGGEHPAAKVVLRGREQVTRVYANLVRRVTASATTPLQVNGMTAALFELGATAFARAAPRTLIAIETDDDGKIRRVYSVLATRKLAAL